MTALLLLVAAAFLVSSTLAFITLNYFQQQDHQRQRLASISQPENIQVEIAAALVIPKRRSKRTFFTHLKRRRSQRFNSQIPDTLQLIVSALRAGHSPSRAIQIAADEMPPPLSEEFTVALTEIELGMTTAGALARISERIDSPDWELVNVAIATQIQTGGNLAEILSGIAERIRERVRVKAELETLTAEARLSAGILILLPPILILLLVLRDPLYFQPLLTTQIGHTLIAVTVLCQLAGMLTIRQMLNIKI